MLQFLIPMRLFLFLLLFPSFIFAQRGKNGAVTVTSSGVVVNAYTFLTTNVAAGATTLPVASSTLSSNFTSSLAPGDLLFIIQMRGASISGSATSGAGGTIGLPNDSTWGSITSYNNSGKHEFAVVQSVPSSSSITLGCGLQNSYTASGKVQVVRVPRYLSLYVFAGGSITAPPWNGTTGGIVVTEVLGSTTINGNIQVNGMGFRGGALGNNTTVFGALNYAASNAAEGAEKGEGIAGYQADYDVYGGRYGMGAPANGGGGGNGHTCGGGGGANAGLVSNWSGKGNPDLTGTNYSQAWNLEYNGFATSTSSGGGRGGYGFSGSNANAIVAGPNNPGAWGGDGRPNRGGLGGRPLDYSTGRIFFGGGGGAGEQDNGFGGAGGNGGGIVYMLTYGTVTGTGSIEANGAVGQNAAGTPPISSYSGKDGAGGGGGGGAIILQSVGGVNSVSLNANGGNGGNQVLTAGSFYFGNLNEAEGPGGGGGGGYVAISSGTPGISVNGGANGTTNSSALTEFTPNGATMGGAGIGNGTVSVFDVTVPDTTLCGTNQVTVNAVVTGTLPTGTTINFYSSSTSTTTLATGNTFTTPVLSSTTTYYYGTCPGTFRDSFTVTVSTPPAITISLSDTICNGDSIALSVSGGTSYSWTPTGSLNNSTSANPIATPATSTTYTVTATTGPGCNAVDSVTITVINNASLTVSNVTTICEGQTIQLNALGAIGTSYSWSPGITLSDSSIANPFATPVSTTTYNIIADDGSGCHGIDSVVVIVNPRPTLYLGADDTICSGQSTQIITQVNGGTSPYTYFWNNGFNGPGPHNVTPTSISTFSLVVTDVFGCNSDTDSVTISVATPLTLSLTTSADTICPGDSAIITAIAGGGDGNYNYIWNPSGNSGAQQIYNPQVSMSYSVTVSDGCGTTPQSAGGIIEVLQVGGADFSANPQKGCPPLEVSFTDLNSWGTSWSWEFGDGGSSGLQDPENVYTNPGFYDVIFTISAGGCSRTDTAKSLIEVYNIPDASFSVFPDTLIQLGTEVEYSSTGTGVDTWHWTLGDSSVSTEPFVIHTYQDTGLFPVTLLVSGPDGCLDSITRWIRVFEDIIMPNVFTPNGDGDNESFRITGLSGHGNEIIVLNRWGREVYYSPDYDNSWKGDGLAEGTYYYIMRNNKGEIYSGFVTLLR